MADYDGDLGIVFVLLLIVAMIVGTVYLVKEGLEKPRAEKQENASVLKAEAGGTKMKVYRVTVDGTSYLVSCDVVQE